MSNMTMINQELGDELSVTNIISSAIKSASLQQAGAYYNDIEAQFGIDAYACGDTHGGFAAVLKARFSDFCVHEVDIDGNLAELTTLSAEDAINYECSKDGSINNGNACLEAHIETEQDKSSIVTSTTPSEELEISTATIADEDSTIKKHLQDAEAQLFTIVGEEDAKKAIELLLFWSLRSADSPPSPEPPKFHAFPVLENKEQRRQLHLMIQGPLISPYALADTLDSKVRLWHKRFEKEMPNYGKFEKNNNNNKRKHCGNNDNLNKRSKWPSDRPNYLKFVLYKENMDTTTACKELGRIARIPFNNPIGYAGMKDKRGVTSQFCTLYQKTPADLAAVSSASGPGGGNTTSGTVNVLRVGSFTYTNNCMNLGSLAGNRFNVVLRNINVDTTSNAADNVAVRMVEAEKVVQIAATSLKTVGCVNYFGMQRFGKYFDNHKIGIELLKGNFEEAVNMIMKEKKDEQHERVAEARRRWDTRFNQATTKEAAEKTVANSIRKVFGKFMTCESKLMDHLSNRPRDYKGAMLKSLPRNMTLMFLHSLQSFIWNKAASYRISEGGSTAVTVGDLVLVEDSCLAEGGSGTSGLLGKRVDVVTEQDVISKKYSITDVVLPLVGNKIIYPSNSVGGYIDALLKQEGLSKTDLTQREKELTLGGDYRKLICKPSDVQWSIIRYNNPLQPLIQTDLMKLTGETIASSSATDKNSLLGMVISFTLPPSSYATIALRELMKRPTIGDYQKRLKMEGSCEEDLLKSSCSTSNADAKQQKSAKGSSYSNECSATAAVPVLAGKSLM